MSRDYSLPSTAHSLYLRNNKLYMAKKNIIEQIIRLLRTPIAQRKGITIPPDECAIWAEELERQGEQKSAEWNEEIDLEKECKKYLKNNFTSKEAPDEFLTTQMQLDDMVLFAKHFYELGLAQKGE